MALNPCEAPSLSIIFSWLDELLNSKSPGATDGNNALVRKFRNAYRLLTEDIHQYSGLLNELNERVSSTSNAPDTFLQAVLFLLKLINRLIALDMKNYSPDRKPIRGTHTAPSISPEVFSVGQSNTLTSAFQFVIMLGIAPHLLPGVGPAITQRSSHAAIITEIVDADQHKLAENVKFVLDVISPANIKVLFLSKHLGDLLAALLQLVYSPSLLQPGLKDNLKASLEQLLKRSYQPLIVRHLISLPRARAGVKVPWLQTVCGKYLTEILVSTHGVKSVISGMLTPGNEDSRILNMISRVICTPPRNWNLEEYMKTVAPQLLALLDEKDATASVLYARIVSTCISNFSQKDSSVTERYLWKPLAGNMTLQESFHQLSKVLSCTDSPSEWMDSQIMQLLPKIFEFYVEEYRTVITPKRENCELIMQAALKNTSSQKLHEFLQVITTTKLSSDNLEAEELRLKALQNVVDKMCGKSDVEQYFLSLLQDFGKLTTTQESASTESLDFEDRCIQMMVMRLRLMSMLGHLCEKHITACLKQPQSIVDFVQSTVTHMLNQSRVGVPLDEETTGMGLGLLTALFSGAPDLKLTSLKNLNSLSDSLQSLSQTDHVSPDIRALCLNLRVAIATHGLVSLNTSVSLDPQANETNGKHSEKQTPMAVPLDSEYRSALQELCDPLIAVQGHGLISLNKLIAKKDPVTLSDAERLTSLLTANLDHSDTYIYLSAKQALVSLCDVCPDQTIPVMCTKYKSSQHNAEYRMKVGEVIKSTIDRLGEVVVKHRDIILPAVLMACKSTDCSLCSSALVNLGEICRRLHYSLGNYLYEAVECVSNILTTSKEPEITRAGAHCIGSILTDVQDQLFSILGGDNCQKLYRSLKHCVNSTKDDITLHHCALAIQTLDQVVKDTLFPTPTLEKKIYVLDAPPE